MRRKDFRYNRLQCCKNISQYGYCLKHLLAVLNIFNGVFYFNLKKIFLMCKNAFLSCCNYFLCCEECDVLKAFFFVLKGYNIFVVLMSYSDGAITFLYFFLLTVLIINENSYQFGCKTLATVFFNFFWDANEIVICLIRQ